METQLDQLSDYDLIDLCNAMDDQTLRRFVTTHRRALRVCQTVLDQRAERKFQSDPHWSYIQLRPVIKQTKRELTSHMDDVASFMSYGGGYEIQIINGTYRMTYSYTSDDSRARKYNRHGDTVEIEGIDYQISWHPEQLQEGGGHLCEARTKEGHQCRRPAHKNHTYCSVHSYIGE
jgi:hypothetical protein